MACMGVNGASRAVQACVRKTHSAGASLHVSRWTDIAQRAAGEAGVAVPQTTIVPTVDAPADVDAFPGLYPAGLAATMIPARPWLGVLPSPLSAPARSEVLRAWCVQPTDRTDGWRSCH